MASSTTPASSWSPRRASPILWRSLPPAPGRRRPSTNCWPTYRRWSMATWPSGAGEVEVIPGHVAVLPRRPSEEQGAVRGQTRGVRLAVSDAGPEVRALSDWLTRAGGGLGAIREVVDTVLGAQCRWEEVVERFYQRSEQGGEQ